MKAVEHHITLVIDSLYNEPENRCNIPQVLSELSKGYNTLPSEYKEILPLSSLSATPGALVEFQCQVQNVVRTRMPAFSDYGAKLSVFRSETLAGGRANSLEVNLVSLGCAIRDVDTKAVTPIVVKIFNRDRTIRKGHFIKVIGILAYVPSFDKLLRQRRHAAPNVLSEHDMHNPNPPAVRRVHAIFHEIVSPTVKKTPEQVFAPSLGGRAWCALQ